MKEKIGKYLELTKPKVTLLNLLVGVTCFLLAAYPTVDWLKLVAFSIVGYLAAGGCGVLNSVYDRDVDKLMTRTSKRAIPSGYITSTKALTFGTALIVSSFAFSYFFFNPLTFLMLALGLVFYLADLHCLAQTHKPLERSNRRFRRLFRRFCRLGGSCWNVEFNGFACWCT